MRRGSEKQPREIGESGEYLDKSGHCVRAVSVEKNGRQWGGEEMSRPQADRSWTTFDRAIV